jgi:arylsulfatase A
VQIVSTPASLPNIIYVLADDLGYGDVRCNNAKSKIPTPNLDRLAERGMRFSDAHAGSSVCTPSRYNLLTGRYSWRSRLKASIVWEWDGALIEPDRTIVAGFLRDHGYRFSTRGHASMGEGTARHRARHLGGRPSGAHARRLAICHTGGYPLRAAGVPGRFHGDLR